MPGNASSIDVGATLLSPQGQRALSEMQYDFDPLDLQSLRRSIAAFKADLRRHPPEPADDLGHRWARLGAAQAAMGRLIERRGAFRDALLSFEEALQRLPRRRHRERWCDVQEARATVHFTLGMATDDPKIEDAHFAAAVEALSSAIAGTRRLAELTAWRRRHRLLGETLLLLHADAATRDGVAAAISATKKALRTFPATDSSAARGELLGQLAKAQAAYAAITGGERDLAEAAESARAAAILLRRRKLSPAWAELNGDLADILADQGDASGDTCYYKEAVRLLRVAIKIDEEAGRPPRADRQFQLAQTLYSLGREQESPSNLRAAAAAYLPAIAEFKRVRAVGPSLRAELNRGYALQTLGDMISSRPVMMQAMEIAEDVARRASKKLDPEFWASAQMSFALALQSLGEVDANPEILRRAISILVRGQTVVDRQTSAPDWARFEHNRATSLSKLGELSGEPRDLRAAIAGFLAALEIPMSLIEQAETLNGLAIARQRLGGVLRDRKVLLQAVDDYSRQMSVLRQLLFPRGFARVWNNQGTAFQELADITGEASYIEQALHSFDQALTKLNRRNSPLDWAMVQLNRGGALLSHGEILSPAGAGHLAQALASFREALKIYRPERAPLEYGKAMHNQGRCFLSLAVFSRDRRHVLSAKRAFKAALVVFDRNGASEQRQDTSGYFAHALVRLGRFTEAESLLRKTLARSSAALRSAARSAESRDHAVSQVGELYALMCLCRLRRPKADAMGALQAAEDGRARLLREGLKDPSIHAGVSRGRAPLSPKYLRALVPTGGAIVMPVLTFETSFTFVFTAEKGLVVIENKLKPLKLGQVLAQARVWLHTYQQTVGAQGFRRIGADSGERYRLWNDEIARMARWIWSALAEPIDDYLRITAGLSAGASVVLMPPSPLNILPLHAAAPEPGEHCFGERWTVSLAPSLDTLRVCQARARERHDNPARLLAVIGPGTELNMARAEGQFLETRFAAIAPTILRQTEARGAEVKSRLATTTHFHVSSHGRHNPDAPRLSVLELAEGDVTLIDLASDRLGRLRLAYLAACESGLAGVRRMEDEYIGLPSGFLQAGAASVIGSLWPVFDDATYLLTRRFYELHLSEDGVGLAAPAEALREAQAWLRNLTHTDVADLLVGAAGRNAGSALRFDSVDVDPSGNFGAAKERPFAALQEWAGFVVFGA